MNTLGIIKVCCLGGFLAGCIGLGGSEWAQADVTGQLESGSETFTGQVVGGDLTLGGAAVAPVKEM